MGLDRPDSRAGRRARVRHLRSRLDCPRGSTAHHCRGRLTDEEALELGPLIKSVSQALHQTTACQKTYVVQFAEHPDDPHVHVHVIPRALELPVHLLRPGMFSQLGGPIGEWVPEDQMNEIAVRLRGILVLRT